MPPLTCSPRSRRRPTASCAESPLTSSTRCSPRARTDLTARPWSCGFGQPRGCGFLHSAAESVLRRAGFVRALDAVSGKRVERGREGDGSSGYLQLAATASSTGEWPLRGHRRCPPWPLGPRRCYPDAGEVMWCGTVQVSRVPPTFPGRTVKVPPCQAARRRRSASPPSRGAAARPMPSSTTHAVTAMSYRSHSALGDGRHWAARLTLPRLTATDGPRILGRQARRAGSGAVPTLHIAHDPRADELLGRDPL